MSADDDVDWTWCALAQDCVDVIQRHVVNHSVVNLHDLITTPEGKEEVQEKVLERKVQQKCVKC